MILAPTLMREPVDLSRYLTSKPSDTNAHHTQHIPFSSSFCFDYCIKLLLAGLLLPVVTKMSASAYTCQSLVLSDCELTLVQPGRKGAEKRDLDVCVCIAVSLIGCFHGEMIMTGVWTIRLAYCSRLDVSLSLLCEKANFLETGMRRGRGKGGVRCVGVRSFRGY